MLFAVFLCAEDPRDPGIIICQPSASQTDGTDPGDSQRAAELEKANKGVNLIMQDREVDSGILQGLFSCDSPNMILEYTYFRNT